MTDAAERYAENVGRPHQNLPAEHPDRWQWEYRGTKAEREQLADRLGLDEQAEEAVVIDGQQDIFGGEA